LPLAVMLLAVAMLASVEGQYPWTEVPALFLAAFLFVVSRTRVGLDGSTRGIDVAVLAALAVIALQLVPLPAPLVRAVSPATQPLQDAYRLTPLTYWRSLSVHPAATRSGLGLALTAALVFWTARDVFSFGGTRAALRLLSVTGLLCGIVALAQHATAPRTILWIDRLPDPRAVPFGPFIDRNHLATWLVLGISAVSGYLAMHVQAHLAERLRHGRRAVLMALFEPVAVLTLASLGVMLTTLAATLSRSGFIALMTAALVGAALSKVRARVVFRVGAVAVALLLAVAAWLNAQGLVGRVLETLAPPNPAAVSRVVIWRDSMRIVRDFPLFGTGVGTFADAMFIYQKTARDVLFNHAHDEYLQITADGGIVLLIIVVVGVAFLARTARSRLADDRGTHRFVRVGACAGLAAVAVQSIWETGLRAPANLFLAAVLAGFAVSRVDHQSPTEHV
jgi:O-antigen ligase